METSAPEETPVADPIIEDDDEVTVDEDDAPAGP